ncbi:hypothetical protein [Rhizobium brockwellii]|uniref:hypothetical protein n=1 Tax=Rhizobium brockwellii TaxID=3019932 RepID=UPI00293DACE1|nr:hypothetical protein [Rhizobium brockwellii]MDV4159327.1 hypothetical protein [Rhizobium brockwellii]
MDSFDQDTMIAEIVAGMKIWDADAKHNQPGNPDNFEQALHQEESRSVIIWSRLRDFLPPYVKLRTPENVWPTDAEFKESIKVALNESEFFLTQNLIKRHLGGDEAASLGELANLRFNRTEDMVRWDRYKDKLTSKIFDPMRMLLLWNIEPEERDNNNNGGSIARWNISAGPSLVAFDKHVFQPLRQHWWKQFFSGNHGNHLK